MTNRVRLTEAAATRFPDLAGRTGTMVPAWNPPDTEPQIDDSDLAARRVGRTGRRPHMAPAG